MKSLRKYLEIHNRTDAEDPLKVFRYQIEIDQFARFGFSKMSGLSSKTEITMYREGGDNATAKKSPGLTSFPDVTFERGQIVAAGYGDKDCLTWYTQVFDVSTKTANSANDFRRTIDVVQFNKEGDEIYRWRLKQAWVSEHYPLTDPEALKSDNSVEKMVVAHEGYSLVT